jgi:type IV pilus assembly protein PilY1
MKKIEQNAIKKSYRQKILATSIAAIYTGLMASSVTQASDIDIYQEAKSGEITLMMMMDISTSMNGGGTARSDLGLSRDDCSGSSTASSNSSSLPNYGYRRTYCTVSASRFSALSTGNAANKIKAAKISTACNKQTNNDYHCGDRIARMKDALYELLNGSTAKGVNALDDSKVIGLSTLGAKDANGNYQNLGAILVPAKALGYQASSTAKTQRQLLTASVQGLTGISATPTALAYAEVINYLMGKRPNKLSGFNISDASTKTGSGTSQTYEKPSSLTQSNDIQKCSGQGVYVLTDGEPNSQTNDTLSNMRTGLSTSFSCTTSNNWDCQHKGAISLVEKNNPIGLEVRTAVVGFGDVFESVSSYNKNLSQADNIANLGGCTATANGCGNGNDAKNAALWGILGGGGWYSGSSSEDVVNSVNSFLNDLNKGIPSVTTGSPSVPQDSLNTSMIQNFAYYPQFKPTPEKSYQLWAGNLKKYAIIDGVLKDKNKNTILDTDGSIKDNYDLWAASVVEADKNADEFTAGSTKFALRGGVFSNLKLGLNASGVAQRIVLTNRIATTGSGSSAQFGNSTTLRKVALTDLTDSTYKYDNANNSYFMGLLGYNVNDVSNPTTTTFNKELRQIGAVMHSTPLLLTNKGKIAYDKTTKMISSEGREDYILFGTSQGVLHVVRAGKHKLTNGNITDSGDAGGDEVFTFVPNEMLDKQKNAFLKYDSTSGGVNNLYYGVDGPWTAYSEYVVDSNGYLTVGSGKGTQKGSQAVYGGLRMGGYSYYALDLQDMSDPKLKFHIDPENQKVFYNNSSKSVSPLQYMGQSWSKPAIGWVNWRDSSNKIIRKQVMIVGGGYDASSGTTACNTGTDTVSQSVGYECPKFAPTSSAPAKGAGVYMFDAQNGDLLWWAGANATNSTTVPLASNVSTMINSVASEIRTVDRDGDDLIDNIYFGDLGGQVFRVDFDNKAAALSSIVKAPVRLLNLSKTGGMSPRFYDMPAFSLYSDQGTVFALISIGSGNRSKPLQDYAASADYDAVYNIYDKDVANKNLMSLTAYSTKDIIKTELQLITDADRKDNTILKAPYASTKGWYYEYKTCSGPASCSNYKFQSEKVFGTPIAMNKVLYVTTFDGSRPGISGDCGAGVKGQSYLSRICLPYGQCDKTKFDSSWYNKDDIGVGIHTGTVIGDGSGSGSGGSGSGSGGSGSGAGGSENNYCLSTGTRSIYNGLLGNTGEASKICLIPQRWYAKLK